MSTEVEKGDKVSWAWGSAQPSGTASEVKPGEVTVVSHRGNEISKSGTEDNPAVHIERSGNDVVKLADELNVTRKADGAGETNGSSSNGTSVEKKEESSSAKEAEDAQAGDKRKASEPAESTIESTTEENGTTAEDSKKLKVANGKAAPAPKEKTPAPKKERTPAPAKEEKTPAPAKKEVAPPAPAEAKDEAAPAPAPTEKKKPGRPKGANSTGAKKEKKVPAVGQAQRKTRSQGAAPENGL